MALRLRGHAYEGTLIGGPFNADPHPGNFFFRPEGEVAFLDFGCVQEAVAEQRRLGIARLDVHVDYATVELEFLNPAQKVTPP